MTDMYFQRPLKLRKDTYSHAAPGSKIVSRQKLNSNRENIVLYSINFGFFLIAIEFLTTNDLDSVFVTTLLGYRLVTCRLYFVQGELGRQRGGIWL